MKEEGILPRRGYRFVEIAQNIWLCPVQGLP